MNLSTLLFEAFASRHRPLASEIIRPNVSPYEAEKLRELLAEKTSLELTDHELRTVVEGNLWMLTPQAFLYFLPAFLRASLESYESVSVFASELIGALTDPSRANVIEELDKLAERPSGLGLSPAITELLRKQQLEWFDSGTPTAIFHERFDHLAHAEGTAVLAFFVAFQKVHGANFPFDELKTAVDRHWARYR